MCVCLAVTGIDRGSISRFLRLATELCIHVTPDPVFQCAYTRPIDGYETIAGALFGRYLAVACERLPWTMLELVARR
jgi:hypothetical protein